MAERVVERVHHPVGDIVDRAVAGARHDLRRVREGGALVGRADELELGHGGEHGLGALLGAVEIARRRQPRRRLDQAGEQRGFGERNVARRLAEIALRGLLDAVGAGAEIDAVEIELEDLGLGEFPFQPERQQHLLQLAVDRALLRQKQILRQLLGDGGAALAHAAVQDVGDERARDAEGVDAVVLVEAAVLDGDEGLRHVTRQVLERQRLAGEVAAARQRAALGIDDLDRRRPLGDFERLDRRQMRADIDHGADAADREPQSEHRAPSRSRARSASGAACAACALWRDAARARRLARGSARSAGALSNTGSRRAPFPRLCAIGDPARNAGATLAAGPQARTLERAI